jgi:hypothetical protein
LKATPKKKALANEAMSIVQVIFLPWTISTIQISFFCLHGCGFVSSQLSHNKKNLGIQNREHTIICQKVQDFFVENMVKNK